MSFNQWFNETFTGSCNEIAALIGCTAMSVNRWQKGLTFPPVKWWLEIARSAAFIHSRPLGDVLLEMSNLEIE